MIESQHFHLAAGPSRKETVDRLLALLPKLPVDKGWDIEIRLHKARRSLPQNSLMWSLFDQIIKKGGEAMAGWTREDVKTFMCGEAFGWKRVEVFGRARLQPEHGTSGLNKQQMSDFIDFIVRFMAEKGLVLDMPDDTR